MRSDARKRQQGEAPQTIAHVVSVDEHSARVFIDARYAYERGYADARREIAEDLRTNAAEAWGGDASWLTTGTRVANLAAEWVETD